MLNKIIQWSLHHRVTILLLAAILSAVGIWSLATMRVDVLPEVNKPTVAIFTEGEGLAPEEIERLILSPIEAAVAGTPGVNRVRGTASFGMAIVQAEFDWGTDVYRNRQIIQERLTQARLPEGAKPVLGPVASVMGEIMWIGLTADPSTMSDMELRTLADWTIRPQLLRVSGVSDVVVMGGDVREWQIAMNTTRMRAAGVGLQEIFTAVEGALRNRGGGILVQAAHEYPLRIMLAPKQVEELRSIAISSQGGKTVLLSDVADIREGPSPMRGTASVDGRSGVVLRVMKQPEAETLQVTKDVDATVSTVAASLPANVHLQNDLFRQESFIHAGLANVIDALRDGTIIVILIVILFLMNARVTFITLTAIPLSLLVSAIVFKSAGLTVNVITLGGIAIAIGELVDDAIVDVENVYRRIREWNAGERTETLSQVVFRGSSEVRNSIVYATVLVAIVFLPVFFIPGVEGKLIAPIGFAYLTSLIASLVVSLTVTPVLCSYLLSKARGGKDHGDTRFVRFLKSVARPIIASCVRRPAIVIFPAIAMVIIGAVLYQTAGKEGIPPFNEGSVTINVTLPVGTDLNTTNRLAALVGAEIKALEDVQRVSQTTGRAAADPHDSGANTSEMQVAFTPNTGSGRHEELLHEIQSVLDRYPQAAFSLGQPITHKLDELISGIRAPIVVKVFGDDLSQMRTIAATVAEKLAKQPGIANAQVNREVLIPEVRIYPARGRLAAAGVSLGEVAEQLEGGLLGTSMGQVQLSGAQVDVVARYADVNRSSAAGLQNLSLPFANASSLSQTADVRLEEGLNKISHEGGKRVLVVTANYQGSDIVGAVGNAKAEFEKNQPSAGIFVSFEGAYKSQQENSRLLFWLGAIGIICIFAVLYHAFKSVKLALQVMLNIPTVLIGGIVGIYLTGGVISLAHMVGFISLAGIVSRNGIMLISHARSMASEQEGILTIATVVNATLDRLVPVLMTALSAALALIPLFLGAKEPGKEFLSPIAVVIFGGLISSTFISIFLTPAVFYRFRTGRNKITTM